MKHYTQILILTLLILISTISASGQTLNNKYFAIGFQQDGRSIPIENHQVILKKKTFTIVLYFRQSDSVLVNASFSPESFDQARAGRPLKDIPGFSDLGMAEEAFNPKTLLMISATAPHYWYYLNDSNHRFNDISRTNRMWVCRRIIGQVMYRDITRKTIPVQDISENELYLVFMKTEWTKDFSQQFEKQREYVKMIFR